MEITTHLKGSVLQALPGVEVGTRRAVCEDCGAHAAVVAAGDSVSGACSVCGSGRLRVMDGQLPPPRRWAK